MAFNPFRAFRKHQKVFFAGLTILCMVTFVMCGSMGQGDFFGTIANVFTGRSRASAIATLYGKDISAKEIQELRSQRRLASQYLAELERITSGEAVRSALEASSKWEKSESALVQQTLFSLARMNIPPQRDPRLRQLYSQALDQSLNPLYQLRFQFQSADKTDQANVIDKLIRGLHHEFKQMLRLILVILVDRC